MEFQHKYNYDAIDVAQVVVDYYKAKDINITNLGLQKVLYFIQCYFLQHHDIAFFKDNIEKWPYGPVVRSVYEKCRELGVYVSITSINGANSNKLDEKHKDNMGKEVLIKLEEWVKNNPWLLVKKTHQKDGAWDKTSQYYETISIEDIKNDNTMTDMFNITEDTTLIDILKGVEPINMNNIDKFDINKFKI